MTETESRKTETRDRETERQSKLGGKKIQKI